MAMSADFQDKVNPATRKLAFPRRSRELPGARRSLWQCQEMWYDTKVSNLMLGMVRIRNAQTPKGGKQGTRTSRITFESNQLVS